MSAPGPQTAVPRRGIFTPELLDQCISCGFCLPACPTHKLSADETSSPRGRINLMRALEAGQLGDDDPTVLEESSFCLGCRACEPVCPAGVQYGRLLEEWRDHVWTRRRRSIRLRGLLWVADQRWRVRAMGLVRRHARAKAGEDAPHLMLGCFERVLYPKVSRAARELAPELDARPDQGCCGALHAHNGELERGEQLARELGDRLPGTIVTTAGGCAAHLAGVLGPERVSELSQYLAARGNGGGRVTGGRSVEVDADAPVDGGPARRHDTAAEPVAAAQTDDPDLAEPPQSGAGAAGFQPPQPSPGNRPGGGGRPRIGLQDSCHLRNGLGVHKQPRQLIAQVGEYVELPGAGECCGAAGTYAILRPGDSRRVLDAKLDQIAQAELDYVVAVNPGCQRQLEQGVKRRRLRTRVVHLAELLTAR
jgi:glycolate oxidase iron-sulfur subunit